MFVSFERHLDYKLYDVNRMPEGLASTRKSRLRVNDDVRVLEQVDPRMDIAPM